MRKPRSDSLLKNLPEERQEQIIEWLKEPKTETCLGGAKHARQQLAADGIQVSETTLSDFWHWWHLRRFYQEADEDAQLQEELMRQFDPTDVERARKYGEFIFMQHASRAQDVKAFALVANSMDSRQSLLLKAQIEAKKLELQERRVVLLEERMKEAKEKLTQAMQSSSRGGLTPETLKQIEEAAALL